MVDEFFKWLYSYNINYYNYCLPWYEERKNDDKFFNYCVFDKNKTSGTLEDTGLKNLLIEDIQKSDYFVETGTNLGYLIKELSPYSKFSYSCENDLWYYCMAKFGIGNLKNTEIEFIDSDKFLEKLNITDNTTLFLDAHSGDYDLWNDNPLTKELRVISLKKIKPTIYIHDFGIESDRTESEDIFEHPTLEKKYKFRFDFDSNGTWKLDWDFIKEDVEKIYGKNYKIDYSQNYPSSYLKEVGWIRISKI